MTGSVASRNALRPGDVADRPPVLSRIARFGLLVGPLLSMLDSSIVNVAVPAIAKDFAADLHDVKWVVSGYLLALGVSLAATSYLARRFGTLRIYGLSAIAFVLASAGCALAPSVEVLIGLRAVQGLAGAPLVPLALSILLGGAGLRSGAIPVSAALVLFLAPGSTPRRSRSWPSGSSPRCSARLRARRPDGSRGARPVRSSVDCCCSRATRPGPRTATTPRSTSAWSAIPVPCSPSSCRSHAPWPPSAPCS